MAVALKVKAFSSYNDLCAFCAAGANNVTTITSIVSDNNGQYILFYV